MIEKKTFPKKTKKQNMHENILNVVLVIVFACNFVVFDQ